MRFLKNGGLHQQGQVVQYRFSVEEMRLHLGPSRSGYYDWKRQDLSQRAEEDTVHQSRISELNRQTKGHYCHPPILPTS